MTHGYVILFFLEKNMRVLVSIIDKLWSIGSFLQFIIQLATHSGMPESEPVQAAIIAPIDHTLCTHGFKRLPKIRVTTYFPGNGGALAANNTIILSSELEGETAKGVTSHEVGHIVYGDVGESQPAKEFRADRFEHFLLGNSRAFETLLRDNHEMYKLQQTIAKQSDSLLLQNQLRETHGNFNARIANLRKPLQPGEIRDFRQAINKYNRRMEAPGAPDSRACPSDGQTRSL
jgi:Zn-dependent protease with chaperone function